MDVQAVIRLEAIVVVTETSKNWRDIMALKVGQAVIWTSTDSNDGSKLVLRTGTITKLGKDTIWVDNQHKAEDALYADYAFPDVPVCRELLEYTIAMQAWHEKESKDMLTRQIQTANELVRQGLK